VLINVWIFIASGGRYIIFGLVTHIQNYFGSGQYDTMGNWIRPYIIPCAMDYLSGIILATIILILGCLLTIGWYLLLSPGNDDI